MSEINMVNGKVRVKVQDLLGKCKSKDDMYNILTKCCKLIYNILLTI